MTGDQGDRLWVALWVAKKSSRPLSEVKAVYARSKSWQKSIEELSVKPESLGDFFASSLAGEDEGSLAWAVVMQISEHYMPTPDDFIELKSKGASLKEAILATVLAQLKEDSVVNVFEQAMKDGHWGGQLVASKLTVESLEKFLEDSFSSR